MNNTIQFVVRMQDLMSGGLGKLASTSHSTFSKMANNTKQQTDKNKVLGMSFNELQKQIKDVENTISRSTIPSQIASARRELSSLQSQSAKHIGNTNGSTGSSSGGLGIGGVAVGSMVGNLASRGITAIAGAVRDGVGEMITRSMDKEQAIVGLTTFLGKKEATLAYKNIRNDADVTPFDTTTLLGANRALISANVDRITARKDVMNLGNAVAATSDGKNMPDVMARMAQNLQQIKNNGVATGMDIRQFGFAGINLPELLKRSGQQSDGKITYEMIAKALEMANSKGGMYEGALAAQGQTKAGKWSTVKDRLGNAASDMGEAFSPVIHKMLDLGIKFSSSILAGIAQAQPYIDAFSNTIGIGVDYIMAMVNGTSEWSGWIDNIVDLFNYLSPVVSKIVGYVGSMLGNLFNFIKTSELLKGILSLVVWAAKIALNVISWGADKIMWLWKSVIMPILNSIERAYRWIAGIKDVKVKSTHTIIAPKKPKDSPENSPLGAGGALAASNDALGKAAGDTVAGAAPRTINITVGKFFDNIQFTTMNGKETAQELENIVMECLARVVYNGSKMV
jgi:hypothetical protein